MLFTKQYCMIKTENKRTNVSMASEKEIKSGVNILVGLNQQLLNEIVYERKSYGFF